MAKIEKVSLSNSNNLLKNTSTSKYNIGSNSNVADNVNKILQQNNTTNIQIQNNTNSQDQLKQQVEQIQQQNENLKLDLEQYGVSDKDVDEFSDNRNFLQKIFNLKENTGVLTGTLELLNRPAEALQGVVTNFVTGEGDPIKNFWKGLSGDKEYSINDLGLNIENPLINAAASIAFEVGIDPLNFMDKPLKLLTSKAGSIVKQGISKLGNLLGKNETTDLILTKSKEMFDKVENFFKKTFGTWKDKNALQHTNDISNLRHSAIRTQQQGHQLIKEIYETSGKINDDIIKAIQSNTLDSQTRKWLKQEVGISDTTLNKVIDSNSQQFLIGKEELSNKLHTYYGRLIEENFNHGYSVRKFFDEMLDNGIVEVAAKSIDQVKQGNIYNKLKEFIDYAQKNAKQVYDIEDLVKVEKEINPLTHIGQTILDGNGNVLDNALTSTQGFRISFTEQGKEIFQDYWYNIKKSKTINKFLDVQKITNQQKVLTNLVSKGEAVIPKLDKEGLDTISNIKDLYKRVTGKDLEIITEQYMSGVKLSFAPNKQAYKEYMDIEKSANLLRQKSKDINKFFRPIKENQEKIIANTLDATHFDDLALDFIETNKDILKIDPQTLWEQDKVFIDFVNKNKIIKKGEFDLTNIPKFVTPNNASSRTFGLGFDAFDSWVYSANKSKIKGVNFNMDSIVTKGNSKKINFSFDWTKLNVDERINLVSYMLDRQVIGLNDLVNLGIKSFDDLKDTLKVISLNLVETSIDLTQGGVKSFLDISNWIPNDRIVDVVWLQDLVKKRFNNIYAGDFRKNTTILELQGMFSKQQSVEMLSKFTKRNSDYKELNKSLDQLKKLRENTKELYRQNYKIRLDKDYNKNLNYKNFLENGLVLNDKSFESLGYQLKKKELALDDTNLIEGLKQIVDDTNNEILATTSKIDGISKSIKKSKEYLSSTKFEKLATNFGKNNADELVRDLMKLSNDFNTIDITKPIYIYQNELGNLLLTNSEIGAVKYSLLDMRDFREIKNLDKNLNNLQYYQDMLGTLQDANFEATIVKHMNEFPEFSFNIDNLNNIQANLKNKWSQDLFENLTDNSSTKLFNEKYKKANLKLQEKKLESIEKQLNEIDNVIATNKGEIPKDIINKQKELYELKEKTVNRINTITNNETPLNFPEQPVKDFSNDVIKNIDNPKYNPVDSLSGADIPYKTQYVNDLLNDIKNISELLSPNKIDALRTISSLGGIETAYSKIPQLFENSIKRIVDVQFTIHNSIARNFKNHFGVDMSSWGVNGYMRHMLAPEMANVAMVTNTIKNRLTGSAADFFGNSAKKIGMYREYQAAAADVNLMKANELFNTNPIEATAIALELLPKHFNLGGVFKSMIDNNLIRKVNLKEYSVSWEGVQNLENRLLKEVDKLESVTRRSAYQEKKLLGLKDDLKNIDIYKYTYQKHQGFIDVHFKNSLSQEEIELLASKKEELKELFKTKKNYQELDATDLDLQIEQVQKQIKQLEDRQVSNIPEYLKITANNLKQELTKASQKISTLQSRDFNGRDSWLKNIEGLGKEYIWMDKEVTNRLKDSFEVVQKASGEYDKLFETDWAKQIQDILDDFELHGGSYAIHRSVYDTINRLSTRSISEDGKSIWRALEQLIVKPFKQISVTTVGFHIRNLFTNISNSYLAGFNPLDMVKEMKIAGRELKEFNKTLDDINKLLATGRFRDAESQVQMISDLVNKGIFIDGIDIPFNPVRKQIFNDYFEMLEKGVLGNNHFSNDLATFVGAIRDKAYGKSKRINLSKLNKYTEISWKKVEGLMSKTFEMSKNADDIAKVAMYRLAKSDKYKHLLGGAYDTADKYVKFALFDYNNLTAAEEGVMKVLFPFYTWSKKNLEFQMKNFLRNNKRYRWLANGIRGWRQGLTKGMEESDYNLQYFPIWNDDGNITYVKIQLDGWRAADDILSGKGIINALSPILKAPIEMITGYDFFTGRNFNSNGQFYGFGLGITSLVNTFNIVQKTLFGDYTPTYDDKKVSGIIGKKLIQFAEIGKNIFSYNDNSSSGFNLLVSTFPSVFTQDNLYQVLLYKERERNEILRKIKRQYTN